MEEKENKTEQPSEKVEITSGNSNNSDIVDKKTEKQIMRYNKALIEKGAIPIPIDWDGIIPKKQQTVEEYEQTSIFDL